MYPARELIRISTIKKRLTAWRSDHKLVAGYVVNYMPFQFTFTLAIWGSKLEFKVDKPIIACGPNQASFIR